MNRFLRRAARTIPVLAILGAGVGQVGAASAAPPPWSCGVTISAPGNYTLTKNLVGCTGDGIKITASNVNLNLDNHKVTGALGTTTRPVVPATIPPTTVTLPTLGSFGQNVGIHFMNSSNSSVYDGDVSQFAAGVRIDNGNMNTVKSIKAHDNVGPINTDNNGDGISLWNSNDNTIMDNTVTHNGPYSGIALVTGPYNLYTDAAMFSRRNVVKDNKVVNNNVQLCGTNAGCHPRDPNTGAVTVTPLVPKGGWTSTTLDAGVRVEGPNATDSQVIGNKINDSAIDGIFVQATCHNAFILPGVHPLTDCQGDEGNIRTLIKDNTSNHNGYGRAGQGAGIDLWSMLGLPNVIPATYGTVVGNTAMYNFSDGITIYSTCGMNDFPGLCASNHNTVVENNVSNNGHDGIYVEGGAAYNLVKGNKANMNMNIGIELAGTMAPSNSAPTTNNTVSENNSSGNTVWDNADFNPACGSNTWTSNSGTKNQACIS